MILTEYYGGPLDGRVQEVPPGNRYYAATIENGRLTWIMYSWGDDGRLHYRGAWELTPGDVWSEEA